MTTITNLDEFLYVDQLREAFPELSEEQAEAIEALTMGYLTYNSCMDGKAVTLKDADDAITEVCKGSIAELGELIEALNDYLPLAEKLKAAFDNLNH